MNIATPCLLLPLRSLAQARADIAAKRAASNWMPRCEWYGQHRYEEIARKDGMVIEICMDCKGSPRTYPIGTSSRHSVIDHPILAELEAVGSGKGML